MQKIKCFLIIFLFFTASIFSQTTYYVSSSQGNDSNSGTSESSPWKTIEKVNDMRFHPGDQILFKKGDIWEEKLGLSINYSGTQNNRIVFGAYGNGPKPEISMGYKLTGTWNNKGNNIWQLQDKNLNNGLKMTWVNGVLVKQVGTNGEVYAPSGAFAATSNITSASQVETLNSGYRSEISNGYINLYSSVDPNSSEIYTVSPIFAMNIENSDYITIKDIKFTKVYTAIYLHGSSHIIIDNIEAIGVQYNAVSSERSGNIKCTYVEIENSTFDSGLGDVEGVPYEYYWGRGNWALGIGNGSDHFKIHNNIIKNFHHSEIFMNANETDADSSTLNYNEVFDNYIDVSGINFGRFIEIHGQYCHDNRVYRNTIINQHSLCEISGYHNYIYFNIWKNAELKGHYSDGEKYILEWLIGDSNKDPNSDNYFFNNTIYGCPGSLTLDFGTRNNTFNNLFINYQNVQLWNIPLLVLYNASSGIYKKNIFYSPYSTNNIISYNNSSYTISNWNNINSLIDGNTLLTSNPVIQDESYGLKNPIIGIDISSYIPFSFTTDINGNTIDKANPNVGAVDNSPNEPTGFKVFLEGPYIDGQMKTLLNFNGYIPKTQPYNLSPWNYSGNESVSTIPQNIVDWILVELRSELSPSSVVERQAAFLRTDGSITALDGVSPLKFSSDLTGAYYIVVKHRNHLSVMSSHQVQLNNSTIQYDFTTSEDKAYGENSMVNLGDGVFGMYGGDSDGNGIIDEQDVIDVSQKLFNSGYLEEDSDMNSPVNVLDYKLPNLNMSKSTKVQ